MTTQRFALIYGIVVLVIGVAGFIPGITTPHSHPDVSLTTGLGLVMGLFPINVLHNLVHLLFGGWGLVAARSSGAAVVYAKVSAVVYALLTIVGLIPAANLHTTFGLVPLYGNDIRQRCWPPPRPTSVSCTKTTRTTTRPRNEAFQAGAAGPAAPRCDTVLKEASATLPTANPPGRRSAHSRCCAPRPMRSPAQSGSGCV